MVSTARAVNDVKALYAERRAKARMVRAARSQVEVLEADVWRLRSALDGWASEQNPPNQHEVSLNSFCVSVSLLLVSPHDRSLIVDPSLHPPTHTHTPALCPSFLPCPWS